MTRLDRFFDWAEDALVNSAIWVAKLWDRLRGRP